MKALLLLGALNVLLLAGCGTMDVDVTSWERSTLLPAAKPLPQIRLSAQMLSHSDQLVWIGITNQIATEKIFRRVFTGNDDSLASLDLVTAKLTHNPTSLVDKLVVTYEVETVLRVGETRHTLKAKADGKGWTVDGQMRHAIELATLDLARQCEAILGNK